VSRWSRPDLETLSQVCECILLVQAKRLLNGKYSERE